MNAADEIIASIRPIPTSGLSKRELRQLIEDLEVDLATERFLVRKYKRQMLAYQQELMFGTSE